MRVCIFASSSDGNCLLVSHNNTNILIDAGISSRRIASATAQAGISMENIGGVFITHEHSDHIMGLKTLLKKHRLPLYAPRIVANRLVEMLPDLCDGMNIIPVGEELSLGALTLRAFFTSHDTDESVGYRVEGDGAVFAVATDTGCVTEEIFDALRGAETVLIEANHDKQMLMDGPYPVFLKQRILSDTGHLSNAHCGELARALVDCGTRRVVLGHLSRTNNTPDLALDTVGEALGGAEAELMCAPANGFMDLTIGESAVCCR